MPRLEACRVDVYSTVSRASRNNCARISVGYVKSGIIYAKSLGLALPVLSMECRMILKLQ